MTDVNVTLICRAEDKAKCDAITEQYPGGVGTFGVALTTYGGGRGPITHYAGSGFVNPDMVTALQNSTDPIVMVLPLDDTTILEQLAACEPPLNVVVGGL